MKIIVCIKQVPDTETRIKIDKEKHCVDPEGVNFIISPYDEFALWTALTIKEQLGTGEITAVGLGPARTTEALRKAIAYGADKAILISDDSFQFADAYSAASILSKTISGLEYDLILCGKQAIDSDNAATGIEMAEMLGLPHVGVVTKLEVIPDQKKVVAHREVEGAVEVIEIPLPCVITAQKGIATERYASVKGMMVAKKKPIEEKTPASLGLADAPQPTTRLVSIAYPPERPAGRLVKGDAATAAREVLRLLREEAKVI